MTEPDIHIRIERVRLPSPQPSPPAVAQLLERRITQLLARAPEFQDGTARGLAGTEEDLEAIARAVAARVQAASSARTADPHRLSSERATSGGERGVQK